MKYAFYKIAAIILTAASCLFPAAFFFGCEGQDNSITYKEFGAKGDGVTDDFGAIKSAHEYANEHGVAIVADRDATYYIAPHDGAVTVRTDTDWKNAKFIIDDRDIAVADRARGCSVFDVVSDRQSYSVPVPGNYKLRKGQSDLNLTFDDKVLLKIENAEKRDFIRYGANRNSGSVRQEILLADSAGAVDESTPVIWDYDKVTSITAYCATDRPITICGGRFTTLANRAEGQAYYMRGINVTRSNTTVKDVVHLVEEGDTCAPYFGFFTAQNTHNVLFDNCTMTGHTYINSGTYDTQAVSCNKVEYRNCTQTNDITDDTYWGTMASNFCKNMIMQGCKLSRFDAHQGVYNVTIKDTELGQTLSLVGGGTLTVENVTRYSVNKGQNHFIHLRFDYGSTWDGDVIIKNCTHVTNYSLNYIFLAYWYDWDFGYKCVFPRNVTVDGLTLDYKGGDSYFRACVYSRVTEAAREEIFNSSNPPEITRTINITKCNKQFQTMLEDNGMFSETQVRQN